MATRKQLADETQFQDVVKRYVQSVNSRMNPAISRGHSWVRVTPTTLEELEIEKSSPSRIRFHRIGSLARIGEYEPGLVELKSGRYSAWISEIELITCWVRVIGERDWNPAV